MYKRIYIMGCHRCGTTLLRLILNSHKDIWCFDEWKSYKALKEKNYENEKNATIIGFKIPNWTDMMLYSDECSQHYKNDKVIFMMRDVRGFVASAASLPTGGGNWMKGSILNVREKWPHNKARMVFFQKYGKELNEIEKQSCADFRVAALFWKYKISCYFEMVKKGWQVIPLHYENLVMFPASCLRVIADFLEIEWDEDLLQHHLKQHDEVFNNYAVGNTLASRPIDGGSIFKFKEVLKDDEIKAIMDVAGDLNEFISPLPFTEKQLTC
jgi:hypothetical protein